MKSGQSWPLVRLVSTAGLVFLVLYAGGLWLRPSEAYIRVQTDFLYNLPPIVGIGLSIVAIRGSRGRWRIGWICLASTLVTWQVADWTYSYYDLAHGSAPPFPGFPDPWYYFGYASFLAGIVLLLFPSRTVYYRRWVLDATVALVSVGAIAWEYVLRPTVASDGGQPFAAAVALGYNLADLAILVALGLAVYARGGKFSPLALALASSALLLAATDLIYSYLVTTVGYAPIGNPIDIGWVASYIVLAISFVLPQEKQQESVEAKASVVGVVLPYFAMTPLLALTIRGFAVGDTSAVLIASALTVVVLVFVRQFLVVRDSVALLIEAANHDPLTGVANRRRFHDEVERELARTQSRDLSGAILFLDLDDFKAINDSLGHPAGDKFLTNIAQELQAHLRSTDILARLGGDEFAVMLRETDMRGARAAAKRLSEATRNHTSDIDGQPVRTTASIGAVLFPQHGTSVDQLLARADLAMYQAKDRGRNCTALYDPGADEQGASQARLNWRRRIAEALERELFLIYCQPIVNLRDLQVEQYELLLRMQTEEGGLALPGSFLEIAERFGLVGDIDRWVVRQAISLAGQCQLQNRDIRLAVNLSARALGDTALLKIIRREMQRENIDPARIVFEVTETAAISDFDQAQRFIAELKDLGCRFALDDFGAGFSSFYHLKQLAVDYLKIDGKLVRQVGVDPTGRDVIRAIVGVARALGKETIAEWVEEERLVDVLREVGVDHGQGFYLGRPFPVSELFGDSPVGTLPRHVTNDKPRSVRDSAARPMAEAGKSERLAAVRDKAKT